MKLLEYAATQPEAGRPCKTCSLDDDVYAQIVEARRKGVSNKIIARWVTTEVGRPITSASVGNHFDPTRGHVDAKGNKIQ